MLNKLLTASSPWGISIVVPTKEVVESSIAIAFEHDVTIYDSYFVALAKELNFIFVTADYKLYQKVKGLKFVKLLGEF